MSPEDMRRTGYATVDALVELLTGMRDQPVLRQADPAHVRALLGGSPPEEAEGFDRALDSVLSAVLPYRGNVQHPRYFASVPGSGTWPGALADLVASAVNLDCGNWMESAGPSAVELQVLEWFCAWIGYPPSAGGVLLSGGSAANLTALACARELRSGPRSERAVVYCSDQSHSSIARAARTLGFRPEQVRVLPTDTRFRLPVEALAAAVDADRRAGRSPLLVAANAGATRTGAIDPLPELAAYCAAQGLWLHVDAAYGGFAVLTEQGRRLLAGLELADSVTLDPHKWLYQPVECGALLVRESGALERAFSVTTDHLTGTVAPDGEVDFAERGLQLTRASRALKVWVSLRTFGVSAFRDAVGRSLELASLAQQMVREDRRLELMMDATLGIVCFRRRFSDAEEGDATEADVAYRNAALVASLAYAGTGLVSSTQLRGRYAIRLCVLNHSSTAEDLRSVIEHIASAPVPARLPVAHLDAERVPAPQVHRPVDPAADLWSHPAISGMSGSGRHLAAAAGVEVALPADRVVVRRWAPDRDFYLVLAGELEVDVDGTVVRELRAGDFFGELAAKDWDSGFGYPRLATVTSRSPVRLWRMSAEAFGYLLGSEPSFAATVETAVQERLQHT